MASKPVSKEEIAVAINEYIAKNPDLGVEASYDEASDSYLMQDKNGVKLVVGPGTACTDDEVRIKILEIIMDGRESSPKPTKSPKCMSCPPVGCKVPNTQRSSSLAPLAGLQTLTLEKVRDYFCKNATDEECAFALEVCSIRGLNPFKGDCHLVKYDGKNPKLEILVANSFLLKKAMSNPDFKYFKAGVTVQREDGSIENVIREYAYPGEILLGGWAEMCRKSIEVPFRVEIPLAGNKKESKWWTATPGHMIRKTASSQVAREAFPDELGGLYDVDELGLDPANEVGAS